MLVKKPSKKRVKWEQEFNALVDSYMAEIGATMKEEAQPDFIIAGHRDPMGADWIVQTKAGAMKVIGYGNWVACRFDDAKRAFEVLKAIPSIGTGRLNPYSGKWNFHFAPFEQDCPSAQECFDSFREHLDAIR